MYRHRLVLREGAMNIAPRWGAAAQKAHLYKHRTPLGCRALARQGLCVILWRWDGTRENLTRTRPD